MHLAAITLALLSLPKGEPKPIPWLAEGRYVPETALYELQCVTTVEELCQIRAVEEWSHLLEVKGGALRYFFDAEFGHVLFLPDTVTSTAAEGALFQEDIQAHAVLLDGDRLLARTPKRFVIWRDGEDLVARWSGPNDGTRPGKMKLERLVPWARLEAAVQARAAEMGASLAVCDRGRLAPPSFDTCRLRPAKNAGAEKPAAPAGAESAPAK